MAVLNFYADGAGHPDYVRPLERGDTRYYCLAGILVTDAQREDLERRCDSLVQKFFPDREPRTIELKASWIGAQSHQKPPWDTLPGPQHALLFNDVRDTLLDVKPLLIGQLVQKENYRLNIRASRPERPAANAQRFLMGRLARHLVSSGDTSRVTLDSDSRAVQEAQVNLEAEIRLTGDQIVTPSRPASNASQWEKLLPCQHLSSDQSRCLQVADYVAHWLWQAGEYGKAQRLRELDTLWRTFGLRREPWLAFPEPGREQLIKD
jgi:hypothetical protein